MMTDRKFITTHKRPTKITHYVRLNKSTGDFQVKQASQFMIEGGLTSLWGRQWRAVRAKTNEEAIEMARSFIW